jgi:hypothetical protein
MSMHITLISELFNDDSIQEVIVRDQLMVEDLIADIRREYGLPDEYYVLRLQDGERQLKTGFRLEDVGVKPGAKLTFGVEQPIPENSTKTAALKAEDGTIFPLLRQPALIGRPNPQKQITAGMLDVDMTALDIDKTTSRPHARIVQSEAGYQLESLRDDNPAYVNDVAVPPEHPHLLKHGDQLRFGRVILQMLITDKQT